MDLPIPERLPLNEGIHVIEVLSVTKLDEEGEYGPRYDVHVRYEGEPRTIRASESLYLRLYEYLADGTVKLQVLVTGAGRDTRYAVSAVVT